jgi:hypothetical protein
MARHTNASTGDFRVPRPLGFALLSRYARGMSDGGTPDTAERSEGLGDEEPVRGAGVGGGGAGAGGGATVR